MSDLINRQDAIDAIVAWTVEDRPDIEMPTDLVDRVNALPSAERKIGEWIPEFNGAFTGGAYWFVCSECGRIVPEVRNGGWNFCPNCGANMRERREDETD